MSRFARAEASADLCPQSVGATGGRPLFHHRWHLGDLAISSRRFAILLPVAAFFATALTLLATTTTFAAIEPRASEADQVLLVPQSNQAATAGQTAFSAEVSVPAEADTSARAYRADGRSNTAPSARGDRAMPAAQEAFLAKAAGAAQATQQATGIPASVTIAQAILESDWGRSTVSGANNYFGIKALTQPGPAGITWAPTKEFTKDGWITVQAPFRAYESMEQSFVDHAKFLTENPRYAPALQQSANPQLFAKLIHQAGYATDPKYAQLLTTLMDKFNLYQYDQPNSAPSDSNGVPVDSDESGTNQSNFPQAASPAERSLRQQYPAA